MPNTATDPQLFELQACGLLAPAAIAAVSAYAKMPEVRLILSLGSQTVRASDSLSDFDLVIVYNAGSTTPSKQSRRQLMAETFPEATITDANFADTTRWTVGIADDFMVDGVRLDMMIFTWSELMSKVKEIIQGRYRPEGLYHPLGFLSILEKAVVHIDKDNLFPVIQQELSPYPRTLQHIILEEETTVTFPYYMRQLERAQARGDMLAASDLVQGALTSAIYILLARHKVYYRAPKYIMRQLEKITGKDSELRGQLQSVVEQGTTARSIAQKKRALWKIYASVLGEAAPTPP